MKPFLKVESEQRVKIKRGTKNKKRSLKAATTSTTNNQPTLTVTIIKSGKGKESSSNRKNCKEIIMHLNLRT